MSSVVQLNDGVQIGDGVQITTAKVQLSSSSLVSAAGVNLLGVAGGIPYVTNLTPATTTKILAGYAAMQAGTRNMNIAIMGDSTDRGTDETARPYNSQYPLSIAEQLAAMFRADGIASGANNWYGISGSNFNDYMIRDSRVSATGSTTAFGTAVVCQGGTEVEFPTATGTFSFTPQQNCTKADIYYQDSSAGRQFSWSVDGGAATTITTAGANTIAKTTVALGSLGAHTLKLAWVSGFVRIYGIDCYDDSRKEITFRQWGTSGGTTTTMIDNTGSPNAGRLQQLSLYPVDLAFGDCGIVNSWRNSRSVANCQTDLNTLIDAVHTAGGDFIICIPPFDSSSTGLAAQQQSYVDMMYAVGAAKGCAVFDIRKAWGSKAASDAAGYTSAADAVHPTTLGQANRAVNLKPILRYGMGLAPQVPSGSWPDSYATNLPTLVALSKSQWREPFSTLSLRTGGYASGLNTGYNDPTSKGIWSFNGENYMNTAAQYPGANSWSQMVNGNFNWAATDPSFPAYGMGAIIDLTSAGAKLMGSDQYPLIRAVVPLISGQVPYLGSLLSSASAAKFATPYLRRIRFTLDTMGSADFSALWSLNEHYALDINDPSFKHYEIDDFERFGGDSGLQSLAQSTHIDPGTGIVDGGGSFNTGVNIGPSILHEIVVLHTDGYINMWFDGVLRQQITTPANSAKPNDRHHILLNMLAGLSWERYPGQFTGSISGTTMTVTSIDPSTKLAVGQTITGTGITGGTTISSLGTGTGGTGTYTVNNSQTVASETMQASGVVGTPSITVPIIEILRPYGAALDLIPPTPPVPVVTWGGSFPNGAIPVATAGGTTVATLSGAAGTYSVIGTSKLAVSGGTNLVTVGSLSTGTINFYIRGLDASGVPGIAPKLTATVS